VSHTCQTLLVLMESDGSIAKMTILSVLSGASCLDHGLGIEHNL
jgi:hypothetical protein